MKKLTGTRILAALMVLCTVFASACGAMPPAEVEQGSPVIDNVLSPVLSAGTVGASQTSSNVPVPTGEYDESTVLVKCDGTFSTDLLAQLDFVSAEPIYAGSAWYLVTLGGETDAKDAVEYLTALDGLDRVDYNYIMKTGVVDVSCNPDHKDHDHHHNTHKIPDGWEHMDENDMNPGGSSDVIVAVIDTGVDYNHLDLRNNIWINSAEIPNNGIDDDGNGYVDDVRGWNCVGDNNDPMDDNGHGTHVAGIIAAENNDIGGVGIAFNCKIMVLKAGNSSGYFNNSDIAEAIQYAYMNGASVINMSFGGSNISIAVEEALENAYNSCVLVAAAGNDSLCNNPACRTCLAVGVSYPAALPYVIGVMSTNADGSAVSGFSNYDHSPYNSVEYEVYAVGEAIPSTWPGNKYAILNGTSMAAPTVSAIAALLRSAFPDRDTYSTKYMQSQIVNTGTINPYNAILKTTDREHSVANVYEALTKIPTPDVKLYDYYIDDSTTISEKNNGNGVIDAGERVRLFISLHNRGGVATNVNVSIDTMRNNDPALTDPYFSFTNNTFALSDIGTYSVRESAPDKYFEIIVSPECPNDYLTNFNIRFTYENGMDEKDTTVYSDAGVAQFNVSRGYHLPAIIDKDTVYKADRLYIVGQDVIIPEGVTVTFEEGCEIQFYDDREYYNSPVITVHGVLNFSGTVENMVHIFPSERCSTFACFIDNNGTLNIDYVESINLYIYPYNGTSAICNSILRMNGESRPGSNGDKSLCAYQGGSTIGHYAYRNPMHIDLLDSCYIELTAYACKLIVREMVQSYVLITNKNGIDMSCNSNFSDNIVYTDTNTISTSLSTQKISFGGTVENNMFISANNDNLHTLFMLHFSENDLVANNYFSAGYQENANQIITNYIDSYGNPKVDVFGSCSDISALYPHVVSVEMFDKDGNAITRVGREEIKVRVTFNRPMDTTQNTFLSFGTIEPYADYRIDGEYVSDTVWEGTYTLKAEIENGQNFLKVNNACAAEDITKTVFGEYHLHEFTIDTTAALSMNLQAEPTQDGIKLTWFQDDYDTLLGYNIYRANSKDGNYVKLNPTILLSTDEYFLDDNAEPGKTYWYTYTVVLSDFTESKPAGKVSCTGLDTIAPNLYHTPVNQGYLNNNLVISCTASDNIAIASVTLHYRAVGASEWKKLTMSKQNDKYSATVFGSDLTLEGIEYYIEATDGVSTIARGSAAAPYTVTVKDASSISRLGDVDGDGTVTTKDALMLMQCLAGDLILSDDEFRRADLNGNGALSSSEALRILQYINGKVSSLEM